MADRKRKRKSSSRPAVRPAGGEGRTPSPDSAEPSAEQAGGRDAMRRGYAKAELKNEAAREALEPISAENRPRIVLVACAWLLVIAANIVYNGVTAEGDSATTGRIGNVLMLVLVVMAIVGTYRLRYWAILGAQTILALAAIFGIVAAAVIPDLPLVLLVGGAAVVSGVVFYRMINVMARVQKAELQRRGEL